MNLHAPLPATKDAFLAWVQRHEGRYEFKGGRPVMMIGVTRKHTDVAGNLFAHLWSQIDRNQFAVRNGEFFVDIGDGLRAPDVMVEPAGLPGDERAATSPVLVAEVLSPSSVHLDMQVKAREYGALRSVKVYLVLDQTAPGVYVWRRAADGTWPEAPAEPLIEADETLDLPEIGVALRVGAIYGL